MEIRPFTAMAQQQLAQQMRFQTSASPAVRDEVVFGDRPSPTNYRPPQPETSVPALLTGLRPFIHDVHVVQPGVAGGPPILTGSGLGVKAFIPESLRAIPSQRWTVTPEILDFHRSNLSHTSDAELLASDREELDKVALPLLQKRYGGRHDLNVIEQGPATSTVVPRALGDAVSHYFAMDLSVPLLERQQGLLQDQHAHGAYQVTGNTYDMPFESGTADVVFTSCHPPFVSSSPADRIQAFAEVARVLKPGGEFVLFPFDAKRQDPAVLDYVQKHFQPVDQATSSLLPDRNVVVFRKLE